MGQRASTFGEPGTVYRAFLLRVWRRSPSGETRASLTDVDTGAAHTFSDLDALYEWLGSAIDACPQDESHDTTDRASS